MNTKNKFNDQQQLDRVGFVASVALTIEKIMRMNLLELDTELKSRGLDRTGAGWQMKIRLCVAVDPSVLKKQTCEQGVQIQTEHAVANQSSQEVQVLGEDDSKEEQQRFRCARP